MMKNLMNFIIRAPYVALVFILLLTVFFGYGVSNLEMENTQESELPEENQIVRTKKEIEGIFGKKDVILVGIEHDNIFNYETLNKIKSIEEEIQNIEGVIPDETVSVVSINNIVGKEDELEVGMFISEIPSDPALLAQLKEQAIKNDLMVNRIISADGRFSAIIANIEEGYSEEYVYQSVSEIIKKYAQPEFLFIAGDPIQQKEIDMGIQGDMQRLLPLALLLLIVAYIICFRTVPGVVIPMGVVLLSIIWTMGSMYYLGFKITVISSIIPILMLVISGSYGIHIMHKFYELYTPENKDIKSVREMTFRIMARPLFLTSITSSLGLLSLIVFKVRSIKEFGVIVGLGSIYTFVITILFVSSVLWLIRNRKLKLHKKHGTAIIDKVLGNIAMVSYKNSFVVMAVASIILALSVYGVTQVKIGNDFIEYFPKTHPLTIAYEKFNNNLGGADYLDIMFEGNEPDVIQTPEFLNEMDKLLTYAKENYDFVGTTFSIVDIVKRMNKELHYGDEAFNVIPDDSDEIAQYILLYSMSGNPGDFNSLIDYDYQRVKVRMMLTSSEQDNHKAIYDGLSEYARHNLPGDINIEFGGEAVFWLAQIDYIVKGKIENIICALLIVWLLCTLAFRSFKYGVVSILPLTISSLFTFGLMGFLGIRLETATALISSIGIGIGVDFAIHYISSLRRELRNGVNIENALSYSSVSTGKAILMDVFTTLLGFVVFIFSGFIPIQHFGWLISLTMIGACLSTLFLFPAIFKIIKH